MTELSPRWFGASVKRLEDPRLLRGRGRYLDDLRSPGMLHACFVRSTHAHALIRGIEKPTIAGAFVFTADDLGIDRRMPETVPSPVIKRALVQYPLAREEVCYVGEPIAIVVAESRYLAEDAAALVQVDYDPLPAAMALDGAGPPAHQGAADNLMARMSGKFGDAETAFRTAPHVFAVELQQHRGGGHSLECRGVLAVAQDDALTVWSSTQAPYMVRRHLARYLGLDESRVRVQAPDVGGGFGPKAVFYPEEIVVPLAAMRLGRPVKWIEDRREHFVATTQQRDQLWRLEVACTEEGRILGLRGQAFIDNGAYVPYGNLVAGTALALLPGPYVIPAFDVTIDSIFTNTTPVTPVRGAGRPNACFAMERLVDRIARELQLDPAEIRRRNFVRSDQFPYQQGLKARDGSPITYDSGDYAACLVKAESLADVAGFGRRQTEARAAGRYLGIGLSCCVEDTGVGPFEGATVRVQPSGKVVVMTGAAGQGQGHATVLAQICADALGVRPEDVSVESADTGGFPLGIGTIASRIAVTAGSSVHMAAEEVRRKAIKVAAEQLEAAEADLVIEDGAVHVVGVPQLRVTLAAIAARLAGAAGIALPPGVGPGLEATAYFNATKTPYASSANIAEVEVDIETGAVTLLNYSVAHDCGRLINPMTVDGQIIGGAVHGIGNALFERMIYDGEGQPLTTNYGEYLLPLATELPPIRIAHVETPSPLNPLGIKGAGEGGTIPAIAAVAAAVEDALAPFGVSIDKYPIEPEHLLERIEIATTRL